MKLLGRARLGTILLTIGLITAPDASGFNTDTHQLINRRAADASKLDGHLRDELGFTGGLAERFNGQEVRQWIELGGAAEDLFLRSEKLGAAFRSRHHFHNPLLPWDQAGLNALSFCPPFVLLGQASVRWAQNPDQGISGHAAWADARRAFRDALTLETTKNREAAFAQTSQILGQQMHLVADLAVPAHTRNDPHCPTPEGFEAWASDRDNQLRRGDINAAVQSIVLTSRDDYRDLFAGLTVPLSQIDPVLTTISAVSFHEARAEYQMIRIDNGVRLSYFVLFAIDGDGIWRLKFF